MRDGAVVFEHVEAARLTMRAFSDEFLEHYLDAVGRGGHCRASAAISWRKLGIQLFERIDGDHFTILGLPLLPLLAYLRRQDRWRPDGRGIDYEAACSSSA